MFKKIQDYLLLRHPLLWNVKVVPLVAIMLAIHIVFFIVGYANGAVDFSEANEDHSLDWFEGFAIVIGVLVSILTTVIWLVFYLRNNAFKYYYPKNNASLYHEWLLILLICIMNCTYPLTLMYGKDVRERSYFTEAEAVRRTGIISMASLFADGGYQESGDSVVVGKDGRQIEIHRDTFKYGKRYYLLKSLLNKNITKFSINDSEKDSLLERRVKQWLVKDQKDSVLWVMTEFDRIVKEHRAEGNVTPFKWLNLVYDHPDFARYVNVGRVPFFVSDNSPVPYYDGEVVYSDYEIGGDDVKDTVSNTIKVRQGITYVYPKNYVPLRQLENAYNVISDAYASPKVTFDTMLVGFYFGLMLSLLIFSFRVTSGRSWLIGIVAYGIVAIVIGLVNLLVFKLILYDTVMSRNDEEMYFVWWLFIMAGLYTYFIANRRTRRWSDIVLNILLWLTPWILPVIGMLIALYYNETEVYDGNGVRVDEPQPLEIFLDENIPVFMALCAAFVLAYMYFFTKKIKRWKGIAEA